MIEDWADDEDFVIDRGDPDRFGVPPNLMGRHPEEFFSILGRIVALSAILENKILVFYQHLVGGSQDEHTGMPVGRLIAKARQELHRLPPEDRQLAEDFLLDAKAITEKRNDYVHNLWPVQGGGRLFGWRAVPKQKAPSASVTTEGTLEEMRYDLERLVDLLAVDRMNRVLHLVSGTRHLKA
ncbi:MAG: hypothetical protein JSU06_10015 [Actinobacteria bacterium]|nr:hypothetical protein [Actinomycetota bacterium]